MLIIDIIKNYKTKKASYYNEALLSNDKGL